MKYYLCRRFQYVMWWYSFLWSCLNNGWTHSFSSWGANRAPLQWVCGDCIKINPSYWGLVSEFRILENDYIIVLFFEIITINNVSLFAKLMNIAKFFKITQKSMQYIGPQFLTINENLNNLPAATGKEAVAYASYPILWYIFHCSWFFLWHCSTNVFRMCANYITRVIQ